MQNKINNFIDVLIAECWNEILTDDNFHFTHEEMSDWLWTYEESFNELLDRDRMKAELIPGDSKVTVEEQDRIIEEACEAMIIEAIELAVAELNRRLKDIKDTIKELFKTHTEQAQKA